MRIQKNLLALLFVLMVSTGACQLATNRPERECPIESLVIDATSFPPRAVAQRIVSPLRDAPRESAGRTIDLLSGVANHDVHRYSSAAQAAQEFRQQKERQFITGTNQGPWKVPDESAYSSPIADQYYIACGPVNNRTYCIVIAQYEEYFSKFTTLMTPNFMTFQTLEFVLRAIDERMAQCLNKPLPASVHKMSPATSESYRKGGAAILRTTNH